MPCGNEQYYQGTPPINSTTSARLSDIAEIYHQWRLEEMAHEFGIIHRGTEGADEFDQGMNLMFHALSAWFEQIFALQEACEELLEKHLNDPRSVSPNDWELIANGAERKLTIIYGLEFPCGSWPAGVPYLNLVALREYYTSENQRIENELEVLRERRDRR